MIFAHRLDHGGNNRFASPATSPRGVKDAWHCKNAMCGCRLSRHRFVDASLIIYPDQHVRYRLSLDSVVSQPRRSKLMGVRLHVVSDNPLHGHTRPRLSEPITVPSKLCRTSHSTATFSQRQGCPLHVDHGQETFPGCLSLPHPVLMCSASTL